MSSSRGGRREALRRLFVATLLLAGCQPDEQAEPTALSLQPLPTLIPTPITADPTQPAPSVQEGTPNSSGSIAAPPDEGWTEGEPGIALRHVHVPAADGQAQVPLTIVRLDPSNVAVRVLYDPEHPRPLRTWAEAEQPSLAVNAGYFTETYESTALVISAGVVSGASYDGFGGMLAVRDNGSVDLLALRDTPFDPAEPLTYATQSAPMLVFPGGVPAEINDNGERARRSVVAIDRDGRLLVIVGPTSGLTLRELAAWLATSDLDIDRALNLDGGSSTGLFLKSGPLREQIDSFSPLPIVIFAESRIRS
jgi:uncharacterized protein YigE (DUF2233 family)